MTKTIQYEETRRCLIHLTTESSSEVKDVEESEEEWESDEEVEDSKFQQMDAKDMEQESQLSEEKLIPVPQDGQRINDQAITPNVGDKQTDEKVATKYCNEPDEKETPDSCMVAEGHEGEEDTGIISEDMDVGEIGKAHV